MNCCPNVFSIFRGNKKTITLKAVQAGCGGDPLDLTDCDEIDIALPNQDGTFTHLLLSDDQVEIIDPAVLGKYRAVIEDDVSALLNIGELQTLNVNFTIGGEKITVPYVNAFSVFQGS